MLSLTGHPLYCRCQKTAPFATLDKQMEDFFAQRVADANLLLTSLQEASSLLRDFIDCEAPALFAAFAEETSKASMQMNAIFEVRHERVPALDFTLAGALLEEESERVFRRARDNISMLRASCKETYHQQARCTQQLAKLDAQRKEVLATLTKLECDRIAYLELSNRVQVLGRLLIETRVFLKPEQSKTLIDASTDLSVRQMLNFALVHTLPIRLTGRCFPKVVQQCYAEFIKKRMQLEALFLEYLGDRIGSMLDKTI